MEENIQIQGNTKKKRINAWKFLRIYEKKWKKPTCTSETEIGGKEPEHNL